MVAPHVYDLKGYPKDVALQDGTRVLLKPMTPDDADALLEFFRSIPAEDWYYLKEQVTSPEVIERWAAELNYDRALPLMAWSNNKVVADASLHRTRAVARHHVGEVRVIVAPEFRHKGLGTKVMQELVSLARRRGLERLLLEVVADKEGGAIALAESMGFVKLAVLPGYAKDLEGDAKDVIMFDLRLEY